jgi:hypothetical protein
MNPELEDDLVDLGSATTETKGGPMGFEDSERTFWLTGAGLDQD